MAADRPSAIFLHTGWRSCGTWLWASLRENPAVRAYYEPLHEGLATINRAEIGLFRPNSWRSGHSSTDAYFAEYAPLLNLRGRGVAGYQRRFAFDDFFLEPDADSPALEAYLRQLLRTAEAEGRLPVLKFCRSLGRAAWMRQHFPDALHLTVLRDPGAQWESSRQQFVQHGNRYFLLAPFVILARNAAHPLVADALARLEVALPPRFGRDLGLTVDACWRHVARLSWDDRYRGFLAVWSASMLAALRSDAPVIEAGGLTSDAGYRQGIADMIGRATGLSLSLERGAHPPAGAAVRPLASAAADIALANHGAAGFVAAHAGMLPAAHAAMLVGRLADAPGLAELVGLAGLEHRAAPRGTKNAVLRYLDAAIYIALLRLTWPLRRLHGQLDRAWNARAGRARNAE